MKTVLALETGVLMRLMNAVHDGLQTSDSILSSHCANTIDHLSTFYFENLGKEKPEMHNLNKVRSVPSGHFRRFAHSQTSMRICRILFHKHGFVCVFGNGSRTGSRKTPMNGIPIMQPIVFGMCLFVILHPWLLCRTLTFPSSHLNILCTVCLGIQGKKE